MQKMTITSLTSVSWPNTSPLISCSPWSLNPSRTSLGSAISRKKNADGVGGESKHKASPKPFTIVFFLQLWGVVGGGQYLFVWLHWVLVAACGFISLTRDGTQAVCLGTAESSSLDHQASPTNVTSGKR